MHLAVLFKIFMDEPLVKYRDVLERDIPINLTVTQNTPEIFIQTIRKFSNTLCVNDIKAQLGKMLNNLEIFNPTVTTLEFNVPANDDTIKKLPNYYLFNPNISSLDLTNNTISNFAVVFENRFSSLRYLNLSMSKSIDDRVIINLARLLLCEDTSLISLNLWRTGISERCASALADTLCQNTTLKELDIGCNELSKGIKDIIKALSVNSSLEAFGISYSQLNDEMLNTILKIKSLTYLDLTGNYITDNGARSLCNNTSLRFIELEENEIANKYIFIDIFSMLHNNIKNHPKKEEEVPRIALQKSNRSQYKKFKPKETHKIEPFVYCNWPPQDDEESIL